MECQGSEFQQKGFWYPDQLASTWCHLSTGNKTRAKSTIESLPMCQLWLLSQIAKEKSWPVAMWRSLNLHQERTVRQVCSDWLSPPGGCSPGHTRWCSYHYPFCLHSRTTTSLQPEICQIWSETSKDIILILGDFNGHNYLWGSHDSLANTICVLNDGTHTYLKPHAQHVNKSVIDLTISTLGLALRNEWEVLPDTHGSNHYPILTSILPPVAEIQPSCDPSHWVFSKVDWEKFHGLCLEGITEDILEETDPLHSFVEIKPRLQMTAF